MFEKSTPLGLWYVDYQKDQCVVDCAEEGGPLCGGIASSEDLYADPKTCCEEKLGWQQNDFCEVSVDSGGYHMTCILLIPSNMMCTSSLNSISNIFYPTLLARIHVN